MSFRKLLKYLCTACFAVMAAGGAASAGVLQIDQIAPGDWDETNAVQTGDVGGVGVTLETSPNQWHTTFIDDSTVLTSSQFGSLAQPAGTIADAANLRVVSDDVFTLTVTFQGSLLDPIFYFFDIDAVGATLLLEPGGDVFEVNADGMLSGDLLTVLSGAPDTPGAFLAVQYLGVFLAGSTFEFAFDFTGADFSAENVGFSITSTDFPSEIPIPGAIWMLLIGISALRAASLKRRI